MNQTSKTQEAILPPASMQPAAGFYPSRDTEQSYTRKLPAPRRSLSSRIWRALIYFAAAATIVTLAVLIGYILIQGIPALSWDLFAMESNSTNHSMMPAILNTFFVLIITLALSLVAGIGAALFLNEYCNPRSALVKFMMTCNETLAGVPSIVFGLFGMLFFVKALHMQNCLLAGCFTMALMVLPTVIQSTREALLALPDYYRSGSYGLGAGRFRTITRILLPAAMPGILAGITLVTGRIIGETAALIYTAGTITQIAVNPMESGSTLAVHMYKLLNEGMYMEQAAAVGVVLIVMVLVVNGLGLLASKWAERKLV